MASATNRMHSIDPVHVKVCWKKCCYLWLHFEDNVLRVFGVFSDLTNLAHFHAVTCTMEYFTYNYMHFVNKTEKGNEEASTQHLLPSSYFSGRSICDQQIIAALSGGSRAQPGRLWEGCSLLLVGVRWGGGLPRENFEKMKQNGAIWRANKVFYDKTFLVGLLILITWPWPRPLTFIFNIGRHVLLLYPLLLCYHTH